VELTDAPVFPVGGIVDPPTGGSTSGCEAADYDGVAGKVALVQRGTCAFVDKWALAQEAGATGVIIYNEGNTPERQNPVFVADQPAQPATIAAVTASYAVGNELLQAYKDGLDPTVDLKVYGTFADRFLPQVIAETRGGDPHHVVVVGAHLDSVETGPGINDDGSGTATLLAQAEELASGDHDLRNKIRFAWWGAEENGLVGSTYYARNLTQQHGNADPDNPAGPAGSGKVERVFDDWFTARGRESARVPFDGRSDYVGFTERGIPAGGVFAGAEGVKTEAEAEAEIYGGAAGSWYDPCYDQLCDNLTTVLTGVPPLDAEGLAPEGDDAAKREAQRKMADGALKSLKQLSSAASYAVYYFGASKNPFPAQSRTAEKSGSHYPWHGPGHRISH
jgi:Zn-dependent M28 family amino/carboxypeptidase